MRIKIKNLGILGSADLELGDLTVVCGKNNTGKTYAAYAIYGFLDYWRTRFNFDLGQGYNETLLTQNEILIRADHVLERLPENIERAAKEFCTELPNIFASSTDRFSCTQFSGEINLDNATEFVFPRFRPFGFASFQIETSDDLRNVVIRAISDNIEKQDREGLVTFCRLLMSNAIPQELIPSPWFASADRTGAAILSNELRLLRDEVYQKREFIGRNFPIDYPLPVAHNLNAIRDASLRAKQSSSKFQVAFDGMLGGRFDVRENRLHFCPSESPEIPLTLGESSSSVRALLPLAIPNDNANSYALRNLVAGKSKMFMIDEPEMNLHPENQRRLARYFARLVNEGCRVYITTHSDYIVKELNTLIMLHRKRKHDLNVMSQHGYTQEELLDPAKVRVYMTQEEQASATPEESRRIDATISQKFTFVRANIDAEQGIYLPSFDDTINEMNDIQDKILDCNEE